MEQDKHPILKKYFNVRTISVNGIIATLYFVVTVVCILAVGYPIFLLLSKKTTFFYKGIVATQNTDYKW